LTTVLTTDEIAPQWSYNPTEMSGSPNLAPEVRAQALEGVLESEAFLRSDQLRNFLRFICEMEIAGRAAEISEYSIAARALGRGTGFVPSEDTIVRNRAHALRQRLANFYAKEGSGSAIRIELAKGSYVPRFISVPAEGRVSQGGSERKRISRIGTGLVAAAAVLGVVLLVVLIARFIANESDPTLREAWGPLAAPGGDAILVLGVPPHLLIRVYPSGAHPSNEALDLSVSGPVAEFHDGRSPRREGEELRMHASSSLRFGEVMAALTVAKTLDSMRAAYQVVPDRAIQLSTLRSRNAILIGDPTLTAIIGQELQRTPLSIEYDPTVGDFVVKERTSKGQPLVVAPDAASSGKLRHVPGLLTVLPSDDPPGGNKKTVIFACANSAGCQGAAEFFSSPNSMRELRARFAKEGIHGFPRAYQVVLRCQSDNVALLSFIYEAHRVLDRSVR
jgi:hypothetical protein